jgi:hypothetical protein
MKREPITDAELLAWIESGLMVVCDPDSDNPTLQFRGRKLKAEIIRRNGRRESRGCGPERLTWVVRHNGRKRRVVRSKLVWFACKRQLVPQEHILHHVNENRTDDRISNLECVHEDEHYALHHGMDANDLPEY